MRRHLLWNEGSRGIGAREKPVRRQLTSVGGKDKTMKSFVKYFVDMILFIDLIAIAVSGLLLGFVIPTGRVPHGEKFLLGLHRHAWTDMHLYLALLFVVLIFFHMWLNWTWIVQSTRQHFRKSRKKVLWAICTAVLLVFIVGWIALTP